jgi:hypothetical protein
VDESAIVLLRYGWGESALSAVELVVTVLLRLSAILLAMLRSSSAATLWVLQ